MTIPNIWKVKKEWLPINETTVTGQYERLNDLREKRRKERIREGKIKCPECGRFVEYFCFTVRTYEHGALDYHLNWNTFEREQGDVVSITCVDCGHEILGSNEYKVERYLRGED